MVSRATSSTSALLLLIASTLLYGCGQKGPLYFSDGEPTAAERQLDAEDDNAPTIDVAPVSGS